MAIKKIKVSGTSYDINDQRIAGIDNTPTASSVNLVTSGGVKSYVDFVTITSIDENEYKKPITFAGMQIAPAPLYYNGSSFIIKDDDWNHDSYGSVYGLAEGSYYFDWNECHDVSGVSYGGHSDWRMPTKVEVDAITSNLRTGSTINGTAGCRKAFILVLGVVHAESESGVRGLLLAPDDVTMTGMSKTLTWNANKPSGNDVTAAQLNEYLDAGCVFLPKSNYNIDGLWQQSLAVYWLNTEDDSSFAYCLNITFPDTYSEGDIDTYHYLPKLERYLPCRLVRSVS